MLEQIKFLTNHEQFRKAPLKTVARLGWWRLRCLLSKEAVVKLADTPLRMSLPAQWHGHPKLVYVFGWRHDPELPFLARKIPKGAVVFDIGANIGTWSLILSLAVRENGKIMAFEPTKATYDVLSLNIALDPNVNISAFQYALSKDNGTIRLYHDVDSSRNSIGKTRSDSAVDYEEVQTRTLDRVASELSLHKLDFIKVDVEGAEPFVFEGARTTLKQYKPVILFEVNPPALAELGFSYDSSWQILKDLNYRFYNLRSDTLDEIFQCPREGGNVWAIHSEDKSFL
jgi:FkbM family methyltransferase